MKSLSFIWDEKKDKSNQKKHGISFDEAKTVFYDEFAIEFYDFEHSDDEERFLLLGMSTRARIILVCHCYREDDATIRIISARKATKNELKHYKR